MVHRFGITTGSVDGMFLSSVAVEFGLGGVGER